MTLIVAAGRYVDRLCDDYLPNRRYLASVRIVFALLVLVIPNNWSWVATVPDEFITPTLFVSMFTHSMPNSGVVMVLLAMRYVFAFTLLLGWKTFSSSLCLSAVLIIQSAFMYSFGKIDHFILFESLPIFMAFAGWGKDLSLDSRKSPDGTIKGLPVSLWGMTIAFAYFTAAVPKAISGWLDPQREGTRSFVVASVVDGQIVGALAAQTLRIQSPIFWKTLDFGAVFIEGWLVIAILFPAVFRVGTAVICVFHIGVYLILGINFFSHSIVYAVFFSPWCVWVLNQFWKSNLKKSSKDLENVGFPTKVTLVPLNSYRSRVRGARRSDA